MFSSYLCIMIVVKEDILLKGTLCLKKKNVNNNYFCFTLVTLIAPFSMKKVLKIPCKLGIKAQNLRLKKIVKSR